MMSVRARDLAATLMARRRARRQLLEARARALRAIVSEELGVARSEGLVTRAWLIGSLAGDRFGDASDVDVVVEGLRPDAVGTLWDRLEARVESPVDILRFESLPDRFRARVLREGVALPILDSHEP